MYMGHCCGEMEQRQRSASPPGRGALRRSVASQTYHHWNLIGGYFQVGGRSYSAALLDSLPFPPVDGGVCSSWRSDAFVSCGASTPAGNGTLTCVTGLATNFRKRSEKQKSKMRQTVPSHLICIHYFVQSIKGKRFPVLSSQLSCSSVKLLFPISLYLHSLFTRIYSDIIQRLDLNPERK